MSRGAGKPRVFISSTSEFSALRLLLHQRLGRYYEFIDYEQEDAGGRIDQRLAKLLHYADVVLGIVGAKYGTPCPLNPPKRCKLWDRPKQSGAVCPALTSASGWSFVQWEFSKACEDELHIIPLIRNMPLDELEEQQRPFLSFLTKVEWVGRFSNEAEAFEQADQALRGWQNERWAPDELRNLQASYVLTWVCLAIATVSFILFALTIGLYLVGLLSWLHTQHLLVILVVPTLASLSIAAFRDVVKLLI